MKDLNEGTQYEFRVTAENKAGLGKPSDVSKAWVAKSKYDVPGAPEKPTISDITAESMTISWSPPESDGGSPITGYILEKRDITSKRWLKTSSDAITELTFKVTGLTKGSKYEFRVSAQNKAGTGKPSSPTDATEAKPPI